MVRERQEGASTASTSADLQVQVSQCFNIFLSIVPTQLKTLISLLENKIGCKVDFLRVQKLYAKMLWLMPSHETK